MKVMAIVFLAAGVPASTPQQLDIQIAWATKGPADQPFGAITGMAETANGAVLIADGINNVVYGRQVDGAITVVSRTGRGPNEVLHPTLLANSPDGGVVAFDIGNGRFMKYDRNARFQRFVPAAAGTFTNPKGLAVTSDGSLVVSAGRFRSTHSVFLLDGESGTLRASAMAAAESRDPVAALQTTGGAVAVATDGSILYSNSAPHGIYRMDSKLAHGRLVAQDRSVVPPIADAFSTRINTGGQVRIRHDWFYDQSRFVTQLADGRILNVITRKNRNDSLWEVWNVDGTLQGRTRVNRAYRPFGMTRGGYVLAAVEDPQTDEPSAVALRVLWLMN
jgi:hypothetical protein